MKVLKKTFILCISLMSYFVVSQAANPDYPNRAQFTNRGDGDRWLDPQNWRNYSIPGTNDAVVFSPGKTARLKTSATVLAIQLGVGGSEGLIVDGGALEVVGEGKHDWSIIGYKNDGTLTVQNGGSVTIKNWLLVGKFGTGTLTIYEGSVSIGKNFRQHSQEEGPVDDSATKTTLYSGGVLEANGIDLISGVLDIAGGTLMIRQNVIMQIEQYVEAGRIIAMGGEAGWKIQASMDAKTGWTKVIAVPDNSDNSVPADEQKPICVGMRTPTPYRTVESTL